MRLLLCAWAMCAVASVGATEVSFKNSESYKAPQARLVSVQPQKSDSSDPFILLQVDFRRSAGVTDFRESPQSTSGLQPMPVTDPSPGADTRKLSVARTTLGLSVSAFHEQQSSARLLFELPLNSLFSSDKNMPSGSEFGGLSVALDARYGSALNARAWVYSLSSPKFQLHSRHTESGAGLYFGMQDGLNKDIAASVLFGPEFGFSTNGRQASEQYGGFWGGRAQITGVPPGAGSRLRWSLEALLRRLNGHTVDGVAQGGAGLFTWTPRIEYDLGEGFWIGVLGEIPLFRPVGRETAFGNLSLPGVWGKSIGLSMRAAVL